MNVGDIPSAVMSGEADRINRLSLTPERTYLCHVAGYSRASFRQKITERSPLRHPCLSEAIDDTFALCQVNRIVAQCGNAEAADGEARIKRQSGLSGCPRLIQSAEQPQPGGEKEMRERIISVVLDGPAVPSDSFLIPPEKQHGGGGVAHPIIGHNVSWTKAQRFKSMGFGFLGAPKRNFCEADHVVGVRQILIQGQRMLTLGNALWDPVGENEAAQLAAATLSCVFVSKSPASWRS
jgi:hypothetical protein